MTHRAFMDYQHLGWCLGVTEEELDRAARRYERRAMHTQRIIDTLDGRRAHRRRV